MASLLHSELTKMVPVRARVESKLLKSQKGDSYYVKLRIDRDVLNYTCDTRKIEDQFENLNGKEIEIVAAGGFRNSAWLEIDEIRGGDRGDRGRDERRDSRREERGRDDRRESRRDERPRDDRRDRDTGPELEPEPEPEPRRETREERAEKELKTLRAVRPFSRRLATMWLECFMAVDEEIVPELKARGYAPTMEDVRAITTGIVMKAEGHFYTGDIPTKHPLAGKKPEPGTSTTSAPAQPKPEEPKKPEPKPEPPKSQTKESESDNFGLDDSDDIPF